MEKIKLLREIQSAKFGVTFPKGTTLNYSKSLKSVQHPQHSSVWLRVDEKDFVRL